MKQEYNINLIYRFLYLFIGFYRFVGTELIECDAIIEDYNGNAIYDAIEALDKKDKLIIQSLISLDKDIDYTNELTEDSVILLSSIMDCLSAGNIYKGKKDIRNALNNFKLELEC